MRELKTRIGMALAFANYTDAAHKMRLETAYAYLAGRIERKVS